MPQKALYLASILLLATLRSQAQDFVAPGFGDGAPHKVRLEVSLSAPAPVTGPLSGQVMATIDEGWHINSARPLDDFAIPTVVTITSPVLKSVAVQYPQHIERNFDFASGKLAVYEKSIRIPFTASRIAGDDTVNVSLRYQACDDSVCLPPRTLQQTVRLSAMTISGSAAPTQAGGFTPLSQAPAAAVSSGSTLFSSDIGATFASRGLPLTLLVIFVLGLALNLTPCVYPLIPLTVAYFASQTEGKRSRQLLLSSSYVLGLAITYSALGVFSALSGALFGSWLQQPLVLLFFALMMLVLASSMFGLFEIRVPHFISDRAGARSGVLGAISMGLLAGIVAAPCVGPFIISLIALVGQTGDALLGFTMFFVLALGLGLPYIILGAFSTSMASLPRSGGWMVQVKQALGFVLIAMAFYFLRPVLGDVIYRGGVAVSLLAGGLFLLLKRDPSGHARALRYTCAVLLLIAGVLFAIPQRHGQGMVFTPYSEAALRGAALTGKPVIIDFYATWCLPCKELDEKTFTDPAVIAETARFVRLKADLTNAQTAQTKALTERYRILGVPTIVFIDSSGQEIAAQRLTGFEPPEKFLSRARAVR